MCEVWDDARGGDAGGYPVVSLGADGEREGVGGQAG